MIHLSKAFEKEQSNNDSNFKSCMAIHAYVEAHDRNSFGGAITEIKCGIEEKVSNSSMTSY